MKETKYYLGLVFSHTQREWKSKLLSEDEVNDLARLADSIPQNLIHSPFHSSGLPKPDEITIYAENNGEIISTPFKR